MRSLYQSFTFTGRWIVAAVIGIFSLQCSWTPDVETILHDSSGIYISLQSTQALKIVPKHPILVSETVIKQILEGVTKAPEVGILQQLLLTAPPTVPVFSPPQRDFLAPLISAALTKATPEEVIFFRYRATDEQSSPIEGTVAVFSPTYLLLTLTDTKTFSENSAKINKSSRRLQDIASLAFSPKEAFVKNKTAEAFMSIPSTSQAIVINYHRLSASRAIDPATPSQRSNLNGTQSFQEEIHGTSLEMIKLKEQLQDLQKKVDHQTEEIRRLQQIAPP